MTSAVPPPELQAVIAQFNLGRSIEYHTPEGERCGLRNDPKASRVERERIDGSPMSAPFFAAASCRRCSARLVPSPDGGLPTTCPLLRL
jgi:hypothetical protein